MIDFVAGVVLGTVFCAGFAKLGNMLWDKVQEWLQK